MARKRDPRRDEAFQIWKDSKGSMKLKDIAEQLGVSDTQLRKWKSQDKWEPSKGNVTNSKSNVTNEQAKSRGAPKGNNYAKGNSGNKNPKNKFAERNSAALKHGLFSRYMPKETLEIMGMVAGSDSVNLLWMQIELQFAAIIRAQSIMVVRDKDDMAKEVKKFKETEWGEEVEYEIQFAWDRQATFMNAQSKAMSELRGLIKQFDESAHVDDERRLKLTQMQLGIDKTKAEIEKLLGNDDDGPIEIMISRKDGR